MNDATKLPARTRNALTLEQFYRLCQWLNKWEETFEPSDTMEKLLVDASKEIGCLITTAHMERAISVTGIKPPFMTAADRAAAEAAKTARAEKAGPRLLAACRKALDAWSGDGPPIFLDELRAAIAEAEGE
jgi:hypothetical protein